MTRNLDWVRKQMRRAKRSFLYLSDPMKKIRKSLKLGDRFEVRTCVICGIEFEVRFFPIFNYEGGHYFHGKGDGVELEYWKCDECFGLDEPTRLTDVDE